MPSSFKRTAAEQGQKAFRERLGEEREDAMLSDMQDIGKMMVVAGLLLALVGAVLWKFGGFGPLGRLPGDISVQKENFSFQFPIITCLLLSIVLTVIMWIFRR